MSDFASILGSASPLLGLIKDAPAWLAPAGGFLSSLLGGGGLFGGESEQEKLYKQYMQVLQNMRYPSGMAADASIDPIRRQALGDANVAMSNARSTRYAKGQGGPDTNYGVERAAIANHASDQIANAQDQRYNQLDRDIQAVQDKKLQGMLGGAQMANNLDVNRAQRNSAGNQSIMDLVGMIAKMKKGDVSSPGWLPSHPLQEVDGPNTRKPPSYLDGLYPTAPSPGPNNNGVAFGYPSSGYGMGKKGLFDYPNYQFLTVNRA